MQGHTQLTELQTLVKPYIDRIRQLEQEFVVFRTAANNIAGAYLKGTDIKEEVNIALNTGILTPNNPPQIVSPPGNNRVTTEELEKANVQE